MRKILMTAALLAFLAIPVTAGAQTTTTEYPGATTTTSVEDVVRTVPHGALIAGQSQTFQWCGPPGFVDGPDPDAVLTLNTNPAGTDVVDPPGSGCITQVISLVNPGSALGGARFAAAGLKLAATAPTVSVDGRIYTAQFGTNTLTVFGDGTQGGTLTVHHTFTIGTGGAVGAGALPRTGAMILRWTLAALALVAVGALLVFADRRRRLAPARHTRQPRV